LNRHKQAFEAEGIEGLRKMAESSENVQRLAYVRVVDRTDITIFERSNPGLSFASEAMMVDKSSQTVRPVRDQNSGCCGT